MVELASGDQLILPVTVLATAGPLMLVLLPWYWFRRHKAPIVHLVPWTTVAVALSALTLTLNTVASALNRFTSNCFAWSLFNFIPVQLLSFVVAMKAIVLMLQNLYCFELVKIVSSGYKNDESMAKWWVKNVHKWKNQSFQIKLFVVAQMVMFIPTIIAIIIVPDVFQATYYAESCYTYSAIVGLSVNLFYVSSIGLLGKILWHLRTFNDNFGVKKEVRALFAYLTYTAILYAALRAFSSIQIVSQENEAFIEYLLFALPTYCVGFLLAFFIRESYSKKYEKANVEISFKTAGSHQSMMSFLKTQASSELGSDIRLVRKRSSASGRKSDSTSSGKGKPIPEKISIPSSPSAHSPRQKDARFHVNIKHVLRSETGREKFRDFLISEFSVENYYFFMEVSCFRKLKTQEERMVNARIILDTYVSEESAYCVNISGDVRNNIVNEIEEALKDPSKVLPPEVFNKAQKQVFQIMAGDSFLRFRTSPKYKQFFEEMVEIVRDDEERRFKEKDKSKSPLAEAGKDVKPFEEEKSADLVPSQAPTVLGDELDEF